MVLVADKQQRKDEGNMIKLNVLGAYIITGLLGLFLLVYWVVSLPVLPFVVRKEDEMKEELLAWVVFSWYALIVIGVYVWSFITY